MHGKAVIHVFRLLESPVLHACLKATKQPIAVIVSSLVHSEVVKQGYRQINPVDWYGVIAEVKETRAPAWVHVPGDTDAPIRSGMLPTAGSSG